MIVGDVSKLAMNAKEAHSVEEARTKVRNPVLEPKLDGIRVLVNITEDEVLMYARSGNDKSDKLPKVDDELLRAFNPGTWLDAEAVAFNEDGSQHWGGAQSVMAAAPLKDPIATERMRLVVFDILSDGETDVRSQPFRDRRAILEDYFADGKEILKYTMLVMQKEATQEVHDFIVAAGYEGTMIKALDAPYTSGKRGWAWTKIKLIETADAVITGFKPGKGKYSNQIGAIIFGQYDHDGNFYTERGACSGMSDEQRLDFTGRQEELVGTVIEVSFRTSMPDKKTGLPNYRHPQFERIRWDKTKEECIV